MTRRTRLPLCSLLLLGGGIGLWIGCTQKPEETFVEYGDVAASPKQDDSGADNGNSTPAPQPAPSADEVASREPLVAPRPILTVDGSAADPGATTLTDLDPGLETVVRGNEPGTPGMASVDSGPLEPREPKLLVPENSFSVVGPRDAIRISFDDLNLLKVLNMEPVPEDAIEMFPDWLSELDGKTIRIRGFIRLPDHDFPLKRFMFVPDAQACCFQRRPLVYDLVGVDLIPGTKIKYPGIRPVDIVGTFHIEKDYRDGQWFQMYYMENAELIDRRALRR